jgi:dihydropteroate synthase
MQSKVFSTNKTLNLRGKLIDLGVPKVMGIVNVTPDSFYDGGRYVQENSMLQHVGEMLEEGADIIDVGGHSTRPGAPAISETEERRRVIPAIKQIVKQFQNAAVSVDTFRASLANEAIAEGAAMINDISGGGLDPAMFATVGSLRVPYCLMHMRGNPQTMTRLTDYDNLLMDMIHYFHQKIRQLHDLGAIDIIVDPGFGFAKTAEQGFELLRSLDRLKILGKPILTGLSRKSMIWRTLAIEPEEALNGTTSLNTIALLKGASILRVHDVKEAAESIRLFQRSVL